MPEPQQDFLILPRSTVGTEFASVSIVIEGEQPGELTPPRTLTDTRLDIRTRTTGTRVYLEGHVTTTDTNGLAVLFDQFCQRDAWLVWGSEYLRINRFSHGSGRYEIDCSQAADAAAALLDGNKTTLRIVEPSPPPPDDEWFPAERARAIRDLVGTGRRPSVFVPDQRTPIGVTWKRCDPWAPEFTGVETERL